MMSKIIQETLLLGLVLTLCGMMGVLLARSGRARTLALRILLSGVAVVCLASTDHVIGEIAAAGVLITGVLQTLIIGTADTDQAAS